MLPEQIRSESFIVRFWVEEVAAEGGTHLWRGHITRVATGERIYLVNLYDVTTFIEPHIGPLASIGRGHISLRRWLAWLWRRG